MIATNIAAVRGRRVWDSRGRPTVEAEVDLAGGASGRGMAPAGASTGSGEALDLRDGGTAFGGFDVRRALAGLADEIAPAITGLNAADQAAVDSRLVELDGTPAKSRLGANATLAVSIAVAHAAAAAARQPLWRWLAGSAEPCLPLPEIQIFGGGAHAGRRVDIQDFLIVCPGAGSFAEALDWTAETYRTAGQLMAEAGKLKGVADEGGFWPDFATNDEALDYLARAIERAGFKPVDQVAIALDVAASELGRQGRYRLGLEKRDLDSEAMVELLAGWVGKYPILSVEDPLAEDDAAGFVRFSERFGDRLQIVGDDFLVTDPERVRAASAKRACNTVLIKPNQRGTLSEAKACWDAAREVGFGGIVSARSGETEDVTIIHMAVGWGVPGFKVGSFSRSERMAKWNEGLRIEEGLGSAAKFAGRSALGPGARAAGRQSR